MDATVICIMRWRKQQQGMCERESFDDLSSKLYLATSDHSLLFKTNWIIVAFLSKLKFSPLGNHEDQYLRFFLNEKEWQKQKGV